MTSEPEASNLKAIVERYITSAPEKEKRQGIDYYRNFHDIQKKQANAKYDSYGNIIGIDPALPNNKIIESSYQRAVDDIVNYAFGKPFKITLSENNEEYLEILNKYFSFDFYTLIKKLARDAINCGISYLIPYIDSNGEFLLKYISPLGVFPTWEDLGHTKISKLIRAYSYTDPTLPQRYEIPNIIEIYYKEAMYRFEYYKDDYIKYRAGFDNHYIDFGEVYGDWDEVPVIPFKANDDEIPLIRANKGIQDAQNMNMSILNDDTQTSVKNTKYIAKGYDSTDKKSQKEFENKAQHGNFIMIDKDADIESIKPKMDTEAYAKAIQENRISVAKTNKTVDMEALRNGNSHVTSDAIKASYASMDAVADTILNNFTGSLQKVIVFLNKYLILTGQFKSEFEKVKVNFNFSKNQLINETERIDNICKLHDAGLLSLETALEYIPLPINIQQEIERINKEKNIKDQNKEELNKNNLKET